MSCNGLTVDTAVYEAKSHRLHLQSHFVLMEKKSVVRRLAIIMRAS